LSDEAHRSGGEGEGAVEFFEEGLVVGGGVAVAADAAPGFAEGVVLAGFGAAGFAEDEAEVLVEVVGGVKVATEDGPFDGVLVKG
jgi:hypothetical protein